jgi:hypothetical protein
MKLAQWENFKKVALAGLPDKSQKILVALIVDSPWLPGFMGISTLDYFLLPDEWIKANLYIEERFPEVLFLPGHWLEYGMATEPSAFGCKMKWWKNSPPSVLPAVNDISEAARGRWTDAPDPPSLLEVREVTSETGKPRQDGGGKGPPRDRRPRARDDGADAGPEALSERDEAVH